MKNEEHIQRLNEKIEIVRIRRRCGYLVAVTLMIAAGLLAGIWVNCQLMHQIIYQQEDSLDQLMELRLELDDIDAATADPVSLGTFEITHYCTCAECCGEFADGRTAAGTVATPGRTVAADPAVLPYGTVILIDGQEYVVEDCGGAIKGNRIDILSEDHETALRAGRYRAEVTIKKGCQPAATVDIHA